MWTQSYGELNGLSPLVPIKGTAATSRQTTKLFVGMLAALYIVGCVVVAFVPVRWWVNRQFSLRAMLMVTTLIAGALGLAVYAASK